MGQPTSKTGGAHRRAARDQGAHRQKGVDGPGAYGPPSTYTAGPGDSVGSLDTFVPAPRTEYGGMPGAFPFPPEMPPLLPNVRGQSYAINPMLPGGGPSLLPSGMSQPLAQLPGYNPSFQQQLAGLQQPQLQLPQPQAFSQAGAPLGAAGLLQGQSYHMGAGAMQPIVHAPTLVGGPVPKGSPMPTVPATTAAAGVTSAVAYAPPAMAVAGFPPSYVPPVAVPAVRGASFVGAGPTLMQAPASYVAAPSSYVPQAAVPLMAAPSSVVPMAAPVTTAAASQAIPVNYDRYGGSYAGSYAGSTLQGYQRAEEGITRERPIERAGHDNVIGERTITRDELAATGNLLEDNSYSGYGRGERAYDYGRVERAYDYGQVQRASDYGRVDYGRERLYRETSPVYEQAYSPGESYTPSYREPVRAANADFVGNVRSPYVDAYAYSGNERTTSAVPYYEAAQGGRPVCYV